MKWLVVLICGLIATPCIRAGGVESGEAAVANDFRRHYVCPAAKPLSVPEAEAMQAERSGVFILRTNRMEHCN